MELNTVLSIAIPVVGFFAFLSGYLFGKSDGIKETTILIGNTKKTEFDMKYKRGFCDGFSSGKKYAVENYDEVKKSLLISKPEFPKILKNENSSNI